MKSLLPVLVVVASVASPVSAQTDYQFTINPVTSVVEWDLVLNVGDVIEAPSTFAFAGSLMLETASDNAPFGSATLNEGLLYTAPLQVGGQIPNPVPFLPPVGQFVVANLQATISASNFVVAPGGAFTATAHIVTSGGTLTSAGSLGNADVPLAGMFQTTQPISGSLTQSGTSLILHIDLDVTLNSITPGGGLTGSIALDGPIDAYTSTNAADAMTLLSEQPLQAGGPTTVLVKHAAPAQNTWLTYSNLGLGLTYVSPLLVALDIENAQLARGPVAADGSGNVNFVIGMVPAGLSGTSLWLQAAQYGRKSNVSNTWVE